MQIDDIWEIIERNLFVAKLEICRISISRREVVYARKVLCWLLHRYLNYDNFDIAETLNISVKNVTKYLLNMELIVNNQNYLLSFQQRDVLQSIIAECENLIPLGLLKPTKNLTKIEVVERKGIDVNIVS